MAESGPLVTRSDHRPVSQAFTLYVDTSPVAVTDVYARIHRPTEERTQTASAMAAAVTARLERSQRRPRGSRASADDTSIFSSSFVKRSGLSYVLVSITIKDLRANLRYVVERKHNGTPASRGPRICVPCPKVDIPGVVEGESKRDCCRPRVETHRQGRDEATKRDDACPSRLPAPCWWSPRTSAGSITWSERSAATIAPAGICKCEGIEEVSAVRRHPAARRTVSLMLFHILIFVFCTTTGCCAISFTMRRSTLGFEAGLCNAGIS